MKNFEVLRYIKKWRLLIIAVCILGTIVVYRYADSQQVYTASAVLRYSNPEAESGMTPNGTELDVTEIYSSDVITRVIEDLALTVGGDSIRSRFSIEPIIPEDETVRKEALLDEGEEYEYNPTDYLVSFGVNSNYSKDYAAAVLDSVLKNYFISYGEKYINQTVLPNNAANVPSGTYDYIECAEILDGSANEIYDYLYDKMYHYPDFRSATTGYSFTDLYDMYREDLNYNIPELYSSILNHRISKDQDVLIRNYRNTISQYNIDLTNLAETIDPLYGLIMSYSQKSKDGMQYHYGKDREDGTEAQYENDYILKDVYDDNDADSPNNVNTETTYDGLINRYVELEIGRQYKLVDLQQKQELLTLFENAVPAEDTASAAQEIDEQMGELIARLNQNYETVELTVDEFNQYLGASNITTLTSINVSERINVSLYMMLAVLVFLICGCLVAIFVGRIQDFIEYLLYRDRKTGLPNRTKCDAVINRYAEKPLNDDFAFVLIRLDVLKSVNRQVGRKAGDALLGEFGRMVRDISSNYGFAGYNGSDQFMCVFENCSMKKAEMFVETLKEYIEHYNSRNPDERDIVFSYAIEESKTMGIYDVRGLIGAAFRDIGNAKPQEDSLNNTKSKTKSDEGANA